MVLKSEDCTPSPDDRPIGTSLEASLKLGIIVVTRAKLKKSTGITYFMKTILSA